ncbi:MAG: hypothetical protein IKT56_06620 [Clostridia bacterium]|nr:hypothetical protein [Clostridia bacterium]
MRKAWSLKKIISIMLAVGAFVCISSCSSKTTSGDVDESEFSIATIDVIPSKDTDIPDIEVVEPTNFVILREYGVEDAFLSGGESQDMLGRAIFERNSNISKEYGITFSEVVENDIVERVRADYLSGKPEYDMLILSARSAAVLITEGCLADLESIAGFDAAKPGYYEDVISSLSIGGKSYLAAGDATPSLLLSADTVLLNTDLLAKLGEATEMLYTNGKGVIPLAKEGGFTYDVMMSFSKAFSSLNGVDTATPSGESAAIRADSDDALALYLSGGGVFYQKDGLTDIPFEVEFDGEIEDIYYSVMKIFGFDPRTDAVEFEEENESDSLAGFSLFSVASIAELLALRNEGSPFLPLPMPKMSLEGNYICNVDLSRAAFTAIPAKAPDRERSLAVMNVIYAMSGSIPKIIAESCEPQGEEGAFDVIYQSLSSDILLLMGYGDIESLMTSAVKEQMKSNIFGDRFAERSTVAVKALSILSDKLNGK